MELINPTLPMGVEDIMRLIPHRYPMLLLDRITEFHPNEKIVAIKNVSYSDPVFQGHFPGNPVLPGVMQVEACAQASAVFGMLLEPENNTCLLTEVSGTRFRRPVVPGDTMRLDVRLKKRRKGFYWFDADVFVGDQVASSVQWSAHLSKH